MLLGAVISLICALAQYNAVHNEVQALRPDEYRRSLLLPGMDIFIWNSPLSEMGRRRYLRWRILLCVSTALLAFGFLLKRNNVGALVFGFPFTLFVIAFVCRVRDARRISERNSDRRL